MPIKPENKKLYPPDWKEIRQGILERANNKCEFCGIENHTFREDEHSSVYIVLTIAHLDHDPTNNNQDNLRALCQRCHNRYDSERRKANARRTRRSRKAIKELFD